MIRETLELSPFVRKIAEEISKTDIAPELEDLEEKFRQIDSIFYEKKHAMEGLLENQKLWDKLEITAGDLKFIGNMYSAYYKIHSMHQTVQGIVKTNQSIYDEVMQMAIHKEDIPMRWLTDDSKN